MTVSNFDDILMVMEQDPYLQKAMRRHILTEELPQLPLQVNRLETSMAQFQGGQSRPEAGQEEIKGRIDTMAGLLEDMIRSDYGPRTAPQPANS